MYRHLSFTSHGTMLVDCLRYFLLMFDVSALQTKTMWQTLDCSIDFFDKVVVSAPRVWMSIVTIIWSMRRSFCTFWLVNRSAGIARPAVLDYVNS